MKLPFASSLHCTVYWQWPQPNHLPLWQHVDTLASDWLWLHFPLFPPFIFKINLRLIFGIKTLEPTWTESRPAGRSMLRSTAPACPQKQSKTWFTCHTRPRSNPIHLTVSSEWELLCWPMTTLRIQVSYIELKTCFIEWLSLLLWFHMNRILC